MWLAEGEEYESKLAGKRVQIKGDKEKNRLLAFIDFHFQRTDVGGDKEELGHLHGLAKTIYERGSKGKATRALLHREAQGLVVDTFRLVSTLQRITGLEPVKGILQAS
jgi:hypothetical protein